MIKLIVSDYDGKVIKVERATWLEDAEKALKKWQHGHVVEVETDDWDDFRDLKDDDVFKKVSVRYVGW